MTALRSRPSTLKFVLKVLVFGLDHGVRNRVLSLDLEVQDQKATVNAGIASGM